jgi:hypothetical protein
MPKKWQVSKGAESDYATAEYDIESIFGLKCEFCRFIKLPPGGFIPRHSDNGGRHEGISVYHAVLKTNEDCISVSYVEPVQKIHLPINTLWLFDTWPEHESFNNGNTDRVHLVIDSYD